MMELVNFVSLPVAALLALVGAPLMLRRSGYPWSKTVFGTVIGVVLMLAVWGIVSSLQRKAGLEAMPLGWLVPLAATVTAWKLRPRPS